MGARLNARNDWGPALLKDGVCSMVGIDGRLITYIGLHSSDCTALIDIESANGSAQRDWGLAGDWLGCRCVTGDAFGR